MEVFEAIRTRRSVRRFKPDPLPTELLLKVLGAANLAPSASNRQLWGFTVINRDFLQQLYPLLEESFDRWAKGVPESEYNQKLAELSIPTAEDGSKMRGMRSFFRRLGGAPAAIVVDTERADDPRRRFCNIQDASAVMENLLLAAWAEGLGTCWMCAPIIDAAKEIQEILQIPEDRELIAITPIGYPDHTPEMPPKKDLMTKVRWRGF